VRRQSSVGGHSASSGSSSEWILSTMRAVTGLRLSGPEAPGSNTNSAWNSYQRSRVLMPNCVLGSVPLRVSFSKTKDIPCPCTTDSFKNAWSPPLTGSSTGYWRVIRRYAEHTAKKSSKSDPNWIGIKERRSVAVYVGDDTTDEDAFRALAGTGIGILVAHEPRPTAALYGLEDPREVSVFLERIITHESRRRVHS
jgi:hypothetical protein